MRLAAGAASHIGPRRINQDAAFAAPWAAVVADGVGGGPAGDLASAAIVHRLAAGRLNVDDADALIRAIRGANWDLLAHTRRDPALAGMATTLTGLVITASGAVLLAHSGDSRAYRLRGGALTRQSRDDSLVQALVDHGVIDPSAAAVHPQRNVIVASLGGHEEDGLSVRTADAVIGDRWLLCSDGLSDYVPEDELAHALAASAGPEAAAVALVALAGRAATRDNVTAVVCDIEDGDVGARQEPSFHGAAAVRFAERLDDAS